MFERFSEWLWHRILRRPHKLAVPIQFGSGQPVVLLHGLASDHNNWAYVLPHIRRRCRVIAIDMLGFGRSPKPRRSDYSTKEHARLVLETLDRIGVNRPVILVGHSMGSLVSVEIAKQRPEMVKRLILCGMPIYRNNPPRKSSTMYFSIYKYLIERPRFTLKSAALVTKLLPQMVGFGLTRKTWHANRMSLENTIMRQTTFEDAQKLSMPIDLVCGHFDIFVVKRNLETLAKSKKNITLHMIYERHEIDVGYGQFVAGLIDNSLSMRAKS